MWPFFWLFLATSGTESTEATTQAITTIQLTTIEATTASTIISASEATTTVPGEVFTTSEVLTPTIEVTSTTSIMSETTFGQFNVTVSEQTSSESTTSSSLQSIQTEQSKSLWLIHIPNGLFFYLILDTITLNESVFCSD